MYVNRKKILVKSTFGNLKFLINLALTVNRITEKLLLKIKGT